MKAQLAKIGIDLELEQMESAAGFQAWERADASIAIQATSFGVFEADVVVNTFYMPKGGGVGGRNYPSYMPDPWSSSWPKNRHRSWTRPSAGKYCNNWKTISWKTWTPLGLGCNGAVTCATPGTTSRTSTKPKAARAN